jgi:GDP-D-mannose dehydratase
MTRKTDLVTGTTGQGGSYLIELLIDKVHHLEGDASPARRARGWRPTVDFEALVR